MDLPSHIYGQRVKAGTLKQDDAQQKVVMLFDKLCQELKTYHPPVQSTGLLNTLKGFWQKPVDYRPRGIYLVGPVGRGKSMLMDLFYEQVPVQHKLRTHFHKFMQETYKQFHSLKKQYPSGGDPIPELAKKLSQRAWLLCFDEFQVNDIADAVLLGRLFDQLFKLGVVVVATSNVNIPNLFQNRPGADAFKPFIKILQQQMTEIELFSTKDYRMGRLEDEKRWFIPCNSENTEVLDGVFLSESKGKPVKEVVLTVMGRQFTVNRSAGNIARFSFGELCDIALGVGDYLVIAQQFKVLIIDDIPQFNPEAMNQINRFTMLIDVLYEQNVKLYASAATDFENLYPKEERKVFFERTISRLNEMQGQAWGR